MQLVLQRCCETSLIAMLRVLPSTFNAVTKNLICCRTALMWVENPQHRYSTSFVAMLPNKLHVFCCPFFHTFRNTSRVTISWRLNCPNMSITRVLYSHLTWYNSIWLWRWLPFRYVVESPVTVSVLSTTVLVRTTLIRTIMLNLLMKWLQGWNLSQKIVL